ncbi:alpha/beta fold hydrolase [Crenobacter luteus]|uniref:AB hydrolase-1 domain-containing protein n=1 Tax=Crenobacter luteus TaxID=1452487 RepID=A0A163DNY9_9NEIS|nr:alpha/beta fold hydrolase [Crenobacter luteus]KZE35081.1 hypothetical protein AVW16_04655 [Crenobacter luteus]
MRALTKRCAALAVALGLLGGLAACSPASLHARWVASAARAEGFEARELALPEGRLVYHEAGRGEPLMLLHGFGGNGLVTWKGQATALTRQHRVLVPDLLWFGASHARRAPSLDAQADAIAELIESRDLAGVRLVGVSYGGLVAMEVGRRLPGRIAQLVIINAPGAGFGDAELAAMLARAGAPSAEALFVPAGARELERVMRVVFDRPRPASDFVLEDVRRHYFAGREAELTALMRELVASRGRYLARLDAAALPPIALIWSRKDKVFPLEVGERFAARYRAPLMVADEGGHNLPVEKPEATLKLIEAALAPAAGGE